MEDPIVEVVKPDSPAIDRILLMYDYSCILSVLTCAVPIYFLLFYCTCPESAGCLRSAFVDSAKAIFTLAICLEIQRRIERDLLKIPAYSPKWSQVRCWSRCLAAVYATVPILMGALAHTRLEGTNIFQITNNFIFTHVYAFPVRMPISIVLGLNCWINRGLFSSHSRIILAMAAYIAFYLFLGHTLFGGSIGFTVGRYEL